MKEGELERARAAYAKQLEKAGLAPTQRVAVGVLLALEEEGL